MDWLDYDEKIINCGYLFFFSLDIFKINTPYFQPMIMRNIHVLSQLQSHTDFYFFVQKIQIDKHKNNRKSVLNRNAALLTALG